AALVLWTTTDGLVNLIPDIMLAYRSDLDRRRPAYQWIARQAPASATVFAYDDPVLFLYTGRKSCGLPLPPKLFYYDNLGADRLVRTIPDFARENRLDYLLATTADFHRDLHARGVDQ